jgi:hypothetical protein
MKFSNGGEEGMDQSVIVITKNGSLMKGTLDDYGRLWQDRIINLYESEDFNIFHIACWEKLGKPMEWNGKKSSTTQ